MPWGKFKLAELKLDEDNVRTGHQPDQRAAIAALIDQQGNKLTNLALDLLQFGPSPGEPIWVTADSSDGKHIVLEGNRRVCAFKLLENPDLAAGTVVAAAFSQMAKEFARQPRRQLEAQVFASRQDAEPWIERRHLSPTTGVGLQPWSSLAIERRSAETEGRPVRRSLIVLNFLDDGTNEYADVGNVINAKATTVDRVLNAPALREALGVNIDRNARTITFENGDEIAGRRLLRDLIAAMAKPDFSFSKIRDSGDRDAFVRSFANRAVTGKSSAGTRPSTKTSAATPAVNRATKPLTEPLRPTLAPRTGPRTFLVAGLRLNRLYKECRELKLLGSENAAALLLRVFVELSSEAYLVEKHVPIPASIGTKKGKTFWGELGISLADKVNEVLPKIDVDEQTKRQLKKVRVAISSKHTAGSIDTLHAYIHNLEMNPDEPSLREAWDTWEPYLRLLHAART